MVQTNLNSSHFLVMSEAEVELGYSMVLNYLDRF